MFDPVYEVKFDEVSINQDGNERVQGINTCFVQAPNGDLAIEAVKKSRIGTGRKGNTAKSPKWDHVISVHIHELKLLCERVDLSSIRAF